MEELLKAIEEQNKLWKAWRDAQEKALKDGSTATSEFKAMMGKMEKDLDTLGENISKMQVEAQTPKGVGAEIETKDAKIVRVYQEQKAVFFKFLQKGMGALTDAEQKTMVLADDSSLGYRAPAEYWNELLRTIVEFSPIRQIASVRTISSREIQRPKKTQATTASWIGETGMPSASDMKHGLLKIPAHKIGALCKTSSDALEDVALLEQDIRADFIEQFAAAEGTAFVTGNGNEKPEGIMSNSSVTGVTSTVKAKVDFNDIMDLEASLKAFYDPNARFLMNKTTRNSLRKLRTDDGQYIWQPAVSADVPATILGYPYTICTDMADIAAGAKPIAFGDFRRGYLIVDRRGLSVQVMKELYAPLIGYFGTQRVGGQVILPEAIKVLTVHS